MSAHVPAPGAELGGAATGPGRPGGMPWRTPDGPSRPTDDELDVAVNALGLWRGANRGVTIVAIDGYGASGKSTIAERLSVRTGAGLVRTDDFFLPRAAAA